jgi:hypothetical protein
MRHSTPDGGWAMLGEDAFFHVEVVEKHATF